MSISADEPCDEETKALFLATCNSEASDLAFAFAGGPDERVTAVLGEMRKSMEPRLTDMIGAEAAAALCDVFAAEVRRRKSVYEEISAFRVGGTA
jgi:hypothetical protein